MTTAISSYPLSSYQFLDYIPVASTIFNITCLYFKYVQDSSNEPTIQDQNYTYLRDKSYARCMLLLVPVIGNIIIALYDVFQMANSEDGLDTASEMPLQSSHDSITISQTEDDQSSVETTSTSDTDFSEILERLQRDGMELQQLSDDEKNTLSLVLAAVRQNGLALQFASPTLRDEDAVIHIATAQNPRAIEYASNRLQTNPGIVSSLAWDGEDRELGLRILRFDGTRLQEASEVLRDDKDFVLEVCRYHPEAFQFASVRLRNDPDTLQRIMEFVGADTQKARVILRINGLALQFAEESIRKHQISVWLAIHQNPAAIHFSSTEVLQSNFGVFGIALHITDKRDEILRIFQLNGLSLQFASDTQKDDEEFVRAAVRENGLALEFVSERLRRNAEIVEIATQNNPDAARFALI